MNPFRLFDPDSIAVIVVSATGAEFGFEAMRNVADFDGPRHPTHPNGER